MVSDTLICATCVQVNGVRTKDLDCCQVVPLIVQATGREAHLVISRNPLVWSGEVTPTPSQRYPVPPTPLRCVQTPADIHKCPALNDGDRGIARWRPPSDGFTYLFLPVGSACCALLGHVDSSHRVRRGERRKLMRIFRFGLLARAATRWAWICLYMLTHSCPFATATTTDCFAVWPTSFQSDAPECQLRVRNSTRIYLLVAVALIKLRHDFVPCRCYAFVWAGCMFYKSQICYVLDFKKDLECSLSYI